MSVSASIDALEFVQPFFYGVLVLVAFLQWRRHPGRASAWLGAAFTVLGVVLVAGRLLPEDSVETTVSWARKIMVAILVLFPYCLYRFLRSFVRPIPWMKVAAPTLTAAVALGALTLPSFPQEGEPRPGWFQAYIALLLIQWVLLTGIVAVRLWRAGRGQPTVARYRMRTMSLGAAGLALALVVAGEFSDGSGSALVVQLLALTAAPLMLVGFAPPYVLRAWWERDTGAGPEKAERSLMEATTTSEVTGALLPHARKLLGAEAAVLETEDGEIVASDGLVEDEARLRTNSTSLDAAVSEDSSKRSPVSIPMRSHRLTIFVSPFTPFFGREEMTRLEGLAALADLALSRNALFENQQHLASIVESSEDAIFTYSFDEAITSWNRGAEKMYGYRSEEIVGNSVSILVPPDLANDVPAILEAVRAGKSISHYETKRLTKEGQVIEVSLVASPLRDASGTILGASAIARDITEQTRLKEDLKKAKDAADEANLAKSEFLSRMSHELRTPLNAILGFAQLLEMDVLDPAQRDSTEQIVKGGRRLLELINEVLDIARIESGRLTLSMEPVLLNEVVQECVGLIRPLGEERGIQVHFDGPRDLRDQHVWADRQRLGQVVLNLLSNAVKYNASEGTVTVTCLIADDGTVRVGVTDTGPGIPPDKVPLLFTPFERLGAEATSEEGTGLGLALSKSLVEAMEGRILVDSMMGQGSTFWVELRPAEVSTATASGEVEAAEHQRYGRASRVLYIEDNLSNLRLIERLLERWSEVELISAMTGELGLDLARQHVPDLILLDLDLPDVRGDRVLVRLRKDPKTAHIPVVILSADASPGEIKRLLAAGAADYLTKPIDVSAFLRVVDDMLASPGDR